VRRAGTLLSIIATPLEDGLGTLRRDEAAVRNNLYTRQFQESLAGHQPREEVYRGLAETAGASWPERLMQTHMRTVLADDYLPKVDVATMGASLEGRCPFLDLDVIELAMRMPDEVRFSGGRPKGLLRQLARRYLPAAGVDRRKQGFNAPIGLWFRRDWKDLTDDFILGPQVERRGWFRRDSLQRLVQQHAGGAEHGDLLWAMLILELWIRITVEHSIDPDGTI
jgi:asparagine synthase (glutamine-hydrolysing)